MKAEGRRAKSERIMVKDMREGRRANRERRREKREGRKASREGRLDKRMNGGGRGDMETRGEAKDEVEQWGNREVLRPKKQREARRKERIEESKEKREERREERGEGEERRKSNGR